MAWCALSDAIPLYPVYALLFADSGLSDSQISALFAIWSLVGLVAEVPTGAWADRYSHRSALVLSSLLQGAGFSMWIALPTFAGFAIGFALWGVGGALASGAFEALLYEGLDALGAAERYATVLGRAEAAGFAVQIPIAGLATGLVALGGYPLAAWASIGACAAAAALAATLPPGGALRPAAGVGYLATLRAGLAQALGSGAIRGPLLAVALLTGAEGLEEIFPVLASGWGVPHRVIPLALLVVPLAGTLGAALGGRGARLATGRVTLLLACACTALVVAVVAGRPVGIAGLCLFYGACRLGVVVADARLQHRIGGASRATVTSVASLAGELASVVLFGVLALAY